MAGEEDTAPTSGDAEDSKTESASEQKSAGESEDSEPEGSSSSEGKSGQGGTHLVIIALAVVLVLVLAGVGLAYEEGWLSKKTSPKATYSVIFTESGLAAGTTWVVTLNSKTGTSTTSTVAFDGVANGTYSYSVEEASGDIPHPASGSVKVSGAAVAIPVTYTLPTVAVYPVSFGESGLPSGKSWEVILNSSASTSTTSSLTFYEANGTYAFTVVNVTGFTVSTWASTVSVAGAAVVVPTLVFAPFTYKYSVIFTESGLTAGTTWGVTFDSNAQTSTASSITFGNVPNGTYAYTSGSVAGMLVYPSSGSVVVSGAPVAVPITYALPSAALYPVNFSESGLALGTSWTVILNDTISTSSSGTIAFYEANGTYPYTVSNVTGYTLNTEKSSITVDGAAVLAPAIVYTPVVKSACLTASGNTLTGAGATSVNNLMQVWVSEYTQNTINYQSVGAADGIADLEAATVDFAASDAPLTYSQTQAFSSPTMTLPEAADALTIIFNVPGVADLKVNATFMVDLYTGQFTSWNNTMLQTLNPGVTLPHDNIILAHRSDGAGDSFVFQEWLNDSKSPLWTYGYSLNWLDTFKGNTNNSVVGEKGASGLAGYVADTPNSVGYVALTYALDNHLDYAAVENPSGAFITPTLANTLSAIEDVLAEPGYSLPSGTGNWSGVSMLNAPGAKDYPMATFQYLLFYEDASKVSFSTTMTEAMDQGMWNFFNWTISTNGGQSYSATNYYVPIPATVQAADITTLDSMEWAGGGLCST